MKKEIPNLILIIKILFISCILLLPTIIVKADVSIEKNLVNIYFFHSDDCSHCQKESKLLDSLEEHYSNIFIYRYEIHESNNRELLDKVEKLYKIKATGVPLTIIGDTIYTGYNEDKSPLKFTKTIEYYSKYGYIDRVGETLQIETLPFYQVEDNAPTLDKFLNSYQNYQLIGSIYTDDLEPSLSAFLLGIKSKCNIVNIFSIIITLFLLAKIGGSRNKIILLALYLSLSFLLSIAYVISNQAFTLIIEILILILCMIGLLDYSKTKKRQYLFGNSFIVIAIVSNYIESKFFNSPFSILKTLIPLYNLSGMDKMVYYINYLFAVFTINVLILLLFYIISKKYPKYINICKIAHVTKFYK